MNSKVSTSVLVGSRNGSALAKTSLTYFKVELHSKLNYGTKGYSLTKRKLELFLFFILTLDSRHKTRPGLSYPAHCPKAEADPSLPSSLSEKWGSAFISSMNRPSHMTIQPILFVQNINSIPKRVTIPTTACESVLTPQNLSNKPKHGKDAVFGILKHHFLGPNSGQEDPTELS